MASRGLRICCVIFTVSLFLALDLSSCAQNRARQIGRNGQNHGDARRRTIREVGFTSSSLPEIQPFAFSKNSALGQRASVGCLVIGGTGPFQFEWQQNGRPIVNTATKYARTKSEDLATVVIERVGAEDVGNYTCHVSNTFGTDSYTAALRVEGPYEQQVRQNGGDTSFKLYPTGGDHVAIYSVF